MPDPSTATSASTSPTTSDLPTLLASRGFSVAASAIMDYQPSRAFAAWAEYDKTGRFIHISGIGKFSAPKVLTKKKVHY